MRDESGSATAELVVLAPVLVAFLLFLVGLGRMALSESQLTDAVRAAAQAGVVADSPAAAQAAAQAAAMDTLTSDNITCASPDVAVDVSDFVPGGHLGVRLTCTVSLSDVALPGVPGSRTLSASLVAPVETYRGISQ